MSLIRTDLWPSWSERVNEWVFEHGGGKAFPGSYASLGWAIGGEIVGGIVYYTANPVNCMVNIALSPGWNPRGLIRAGLIYPFEQLGLRRLTFFISSGNIPSINLVTGLGAEHEATLREAEPEGDLHIYALFADSSPIWSRIREQRRKRTGKS